MTPPDRRELASTRLRAALEGLPLVTDGTLQVTLNQIADELVRRRYLVNVGVSMASPIPPARR